MSQDHPGLYGPGYGQYYGLQGYPGVPQPGFPIMGGQPPYGVIMQPHGVPPQQYAAVGDHGAMGQWGLPPIAQSYDQNGGDSHGHISVDRSSSSRSKAGDRKSQATDDADRKQEKGYSKSSDKQRSSSSQDDRTSSYDGHPRDNRDSSRDRYPSDDHASHSHNGDGKKSTKQKEHDDREASKLAIQNIDAMLQDEQLKNILFAGISKATAKLEQSLKTTDKKLENYASTDDSTSRHKAQQSAQTSSADVPQKPKSILKRKTGEERVDVESKVSTESQVSSDSFSKLSALEKTLHLLYGKTNVEDVVRGSGKGSRGSEKSSFKPVGALSQLESYNDSGDDNDHAEKDTKKQTKTKKNAPSTRPFWSADAVQTGKEKDKESEMPDIQEQLYEQWRKSINLSSKVRQATSKEQDVNQLSQETGQAQNLASSSETKKSGDDEEELDSTVQNILQSVGFNFDLSKRMQELARQKKKQQDVLHTGMINQSASFLEQSEGLVQDVRSALFSDKQEKTQLDSLIKEARASMQQRSSYERSASPDALSAEDQRGKSSYGRKGRNADPDDGRSSIGLGSLEIRSDRVLENFSSQGREQISPDTFSSEAQRGGKRSRKGKGPETDDGTSKMDLGSREIRDDRILKKLNSQDWEDISPDEDDMSERVSLKKIEKMRWLYEKQAEVRQQSVSRERDAASPPHSNLLDEAQKLRNMLCGGHEKSLSLSERFRDEPKDEYLYRDDSETSKAAALFAALSSKRKEVSSSSSKSLKLPLQSGSVRVENLRVTSRTVHSGDDEPYIESRKVIRPSKSDVRIVSQSPVFRKSQSPETKVPRKRPASPPLFPVSKEHRVFSERGSINDLQAFLRRSLEENAPEICQALGLNVDSYYKSPMLQNVFGGLNVGGQPVAKRLESPVMSDHFNRDSVRKSPDRQRLRSPDVRTSRSPRRRLSRSPKRQNSRSPVRQMPWSPGRRTSKSTDRWKSRSPDRHLSMSPKRRGSVSPGRHTSRSPVRRRSISLERRRSRSPDRRRSRSPDRRRSRSPDKRRFKSPDRCRSKSPYRQRSRSPDRRRSKSPDRQRSRSPGSQRSRLTNRQRSKSPAMHRYRSLEHHKSRSPARIRSPHRARPRSPGRRRSITPTFMPSRTRPPDRLKQFAKHKFPVRERRTPPKHQTTAFKRQLPADKKLNANRGTQSKMSNMSDKINQPAKTYVSATFEEGGKGLSAAQSKEMSEVQKKGPLKEQPKEHVYELPKAQDKEPKKGQEKEPETGHEEQLKNYNKTEIDILGDFPVDERKIKREDSQVPSVPRSLVSQEKVYYECYDSGNYWCRNCSIHFSSLEQLLEHNHTDKHLSMIETLKKPWKSAEEKQPKRKVGLSRSRQIKGAEMMFPLQGFFCSLCLEFLGDMADAANHLKDDQHYDQYMDFVKKNPIYEKTLLLDKTGVHVKMKFFQLIDPEPPLLPEEEYPGRGSKTVGEQQPKVKASRKNLSVKDASAESDIKNATKDNIEVVDMDLENEEAAKQNIVKVPRLMKPLVVVPTWIPQVTEVPQLEVDMKMTKEDDNHPLDEFLTIGKDSAQLDQVPLSVLVETEFDFIDIPMPEDLSPLLDIPMPEESSPSPEDLETPTESILKYTVKSQQDVREEKSKNPSLPTKDFDTPTELILASLSHTVKSRWELRKEKKSESIIDAKRLMGIDVDDEIEKPMSAVVIIPPSVTQAPLSVAANVQDGMKFNKLEEAVQASTTQTNPQPEELKQAQAADSTLLECYHKLLKAHSPPHSGEMYMKNGLLYRRAGKEGLEHAQLVVPSSYRAQILDMGHNLPFSGHMGINTTTQRISTHFYWPRMNVDIVRYVRSCFHCQREAPKQWITPASLGEIPITGTPFENVAVDIVGPLNRTKRRNRYILTLVDNCSMWAEAVPMPSTDSKHVAEALIGIFTRLGYPLSIIINDESQFRKKLMEEVLRLFQSQQNHTSLFHSASNATMEQFNNTLISILRRLAYEKPETWDTYVPAASFAYMEVPHHLTGFAPATLLFGRPIKGPLEALFRTWTDDKADETVVTVSTYVAELIQCMQHGWKKASDNPRKLRSKIARYYNKKAKGSELEVGEKVMLLLPASQNKFQISWKGPYEVIEKISQTNYRISIRGKHKSFHINSLKKYNERPTT